MPFEEDEEEVMTVVVIVVVDVDVMVVVEVVKPSVPTIVPASTMTTPRSRRGARSVVRCMLLICGVCDESECLFKFRVRKFMCFW